MYISNTTNKEDGVLCFRDTKYSGVTIPNPVNITCHHHGRYVIYYNNRTHKPYPDGYSAFVWTALCEVEVYGNMLSSYDLVPLYGEGLYRLSLLPDLYYVLYIIKICLNKNKYNYILYFFVEQQRNKHCHYTCISPSHHQ